VNQYTLNTVTFEESPLFYPAKPERDQETGCIGHLRADFGRSGNEFWYQWEDHCPELKTQDFRDELQGLINWLCADNLLKDRTAMYEYCSKNSQAKLFGVRENNYGFKIQTENYVYYLRCYPLQGDYNLYVYAYERDKLEKIFVPSDNTLSANEKLKAAEQKYGKDSFEYEYIKNEVSLTLYDYLEVLANIQNELGKRGYKLLNDNETTVQDYLNDYIDHVDVHPLASDKKIVDYIIDRESHTLLRPAAKPSLMAKIKSGKRKAAQQKKPKIKNKKRQETLE
jgi:hypothetical protein